MRLAASMIAALVLAAPLGAVAGGGGEHGTAHASAFDADGALAHSQAAIGRAVGAAQFRDSRARPIRLSDFRGVPLVVSLIYTSCAHTCPVLTRTLADAVDVARDALGAGSFNVVTIGFDVRNDTPERMRLFAASHGLAEAPGWTFLSADEETITRLAKDLGFIYYPSPKGFDHLAQTTVIDAGGTVYRQVYGETFETSLLVEPLKELVFGTTAPFASLDDLVKKVRLFCTIYDPAAGRYRFDYSIFIQMAIGAAVIGFLAIVLVREWRRSRHRRGDRGRSAV